MNTRVSFVRKFVFAAMMMACLVGRADANKEADNRAYVQSGPDGVFYARCVPREARGTAGTTEIYKVRKDGDELLARFDWYTKYGIVLGWSPIAGKVAVMAVFDEAAASGDKQVELAFYLGDKLLKEWTTADLVELGAPASLTKHGIRAVSRALGCEQIPGTNQYVFVVQLGTDKSVQFDILTGEPFKK